MKAWQVQDAFGLEHLVGVNRPEPTVGPEQVRLEVSATSLNYRDLLVVKGQYDPRFTLPLVPLSDAVGVVVERGERVDHLTIGERVAVTFARDWESGRPPRDAHRTTWGGPLDGMLVEQVAVNAHACVPVPSHLTDPEAATLPCAGLTAWSALAVVGRLRAGETLLVQGTGGVSIFALQFGQLLGARVLVTSSRDDKLERARSLGAWETINYVKEPEWGARARELTGGVDQVIDVGGATTLAQSLRAVRPGGTISLIGVLSGRQTSLDLAPVLMNQVRVQGIYVGHRQGFRAMCQAVEQHGVRPVVDRVFDFDAASDAFRYLEQAQHFGKVCIAHPGILTA